jgi:hypothetical protein
VVETTREGRFIKNIFFLRIGNPTLEKCRNLHIRGTLIYAAPKAFAVVQNDRAFMQVLDGRQKKKTQNSQRVILISVWKQLGSEVDKTLDSHAFQEQAWFFVFHQM